MNIVATADSEALDLALVEKVKGAQQSLSGVGGGRSERTGGSCERFATF
jgi:hypothetical protein